jgi:hypothetical protein
MPTERESIRKFLDDRSAVAEWLKRGLAEGRIGCTDAIAGTDEVLTVIAGSDSGGVIGSLQSKCCDCGVLVWLSPSTQEMLTKRGDLPTVIKCLQCVVKDAKVRA